MDIYDNCRDCKNEYPVSMLNYSLEDIEDLEYFDAVKMKNKGVCFYCQVKELQKEFGIDNIILGNEN